MLAYAFLRGVAVLPFWIDRHTSSFPTHLPSYKRFWIMHFLPSHIAANASACHHLPYASQRFVDRPYLNWLDRPWLFMLPRAPCTTAQPY